MVIATDRYAVPSRASRPGWAYALAAAVIGLALFASGTPSPLYGTYRVLWGLSPVALTLVYATYAFGVLVTLLLAGTVSDHVGRRPVLLVALAALMAATVLFMLASSVVWLFAARALQGLATGLALGAASAALLDLHPRRDARAVGLANGVASAAGMGLGVLISAVIVDLLPAPRVVPYLVLALLFAAALIGVAKMPDPVAQRSRPRLTPQRPSVPSSVRPAFLLAALGVISSWSIGGLSLSLGPELSAGLFHTASPLVGALSVFALAGPAAVAQIAFRRSTPWAGAAAGSIALAAGMLAVVIAVSTGSAWLYLAGTIVAGSGFGVAFLGALRALSAAIPPEHRGEVMSAFYVVAYASLSLPAILAGVLDTPVGLRATFEIFGTAIAGLALVVAALAWRSRPREAQSVASVSGPPVRRLSRARTPCAPAP
ncbi:MAG TPA: MFS transporter [Solirubrobacteraceae bacterium]|jgi:MFS family permease|nr:MFS transporter [Solirubrobacteraceae bacterium]